MMSNQDEEGPGYKTTNTQPVRSLTYAVPKELKDDYTELKRQLAKHGMEKHEARVSLILDISGSMQDPNHFFHEEKKGNRVQKLINKALAMAFVFDDNQSIEVFPFGDKAYAPIEITKENFTSATDLVLKSAGGFKHQTNYAAPVKAIREYYFHNNDKLNSPQICDEAPVFAIFITDGEPNAEKIEAINQFRYASHQAVFFKFIALRGCQEDQEFTFLQKLDDCPVKVRPKDEGCFIDNCDLVVLKNPEDLKMEQLLNEYRPWLVEARQKGLLANDPGLEINIAIKAEDRKVSNVNKQGMFGIVQKHPNDNPKQAPRSKSCTIL